MARSKKRILLWILIPIILLGTFALLSVNYLLDPNIYGNILQKSLTTALDREVSIGKAKLDLWGGVGMALEDLRVRDRSLTFDLLRSERLILRVKLLPLLKRKIEWKRIVLDRPTLRVIRDKNGQFNIFSGSAMAGANREETKERIRKALPFLFGCSFAVRDGEIFFSDGSLDNSPLKTEIRSFNFKLKSLFWFHRFLR